MSHEPRNITGAGNPRMKLWRSLAVARGIRRHGRALTAGDRVVAEALATVPNQVREYLFTGEEVIPDLPPQVETFRLAPELFRELDQFGTGRPMVTVDVPSLAPPDTIPADEPLVLMLPFQDPANVGAAVRSAAAFGVRWTVILAEAAHPWHPKSIRASGGQVFRMRFVQGPSINAVGQLQLPVVVLDATGTPIGTFRFPGRCALLPGIEGPGVSVVPAGSASVAIPMVSGVESLNAAVAVSIALYEWSRGGVRENL